MHVEARTENRGKHQRYELDESKYNSLECRIEFGSTHLMCVIVTTVNNFTVSSHHTHFQHCSLEQLACIPIRVRREKTYDGNMSEVHSVQMFLVKP